MSQDDEEKRKKEFLMLYALFERFLQQYHDEDDRDSILEGLMELRAELLIKHAIDGFRMNEEEALDLLKQNNKDLTKLQKERVEILIAAIRNLIDFAVAEEYQCTEQIIDELPEDFDPEDPDTWGDSEDIFERYNYLFADTENLDVEFAMGMAAWWVGIAENSYLTYMTQGDDRVRPWHLALEGVTYRKSEFPDWMIPPIEHRCRCFLVDQSGDTIIDGAINPNNVVAENSDIPSFVNPVFSESVCNKGRIFGPAHSYFTVKQKDKKKLKKIANKIKDKWLKS